MHTYCNDDLRKSSRVICLLNLHNARCKITLIERLRYPGSGLRVRVASFSFRFLLMSAFLPVISTRFPAVNHNLHVNVKRVNLEKKYGEACKYFNDFITHKISDKKAYYKISIFTSYYVDYMSIIGNKFV